MGKTIAIDTPVLIYLLEQNPKYFSFVERLFRRIQKGECTAVFSIIGMIEILTGLKKKERDDLADSYKDLLGHFPFFEIMTINERTVEIASDLRVSYGLKTPDAVHLATAIEHHAEIFYTNDRALKKVKEIHVQLLS